MGIKDIISNSFMMDNGHFADAINYYVHDGEQVVLPENLHNENVVEQAVIQRYGKVLATKKIRDVFKGLTIKSDGITTYALIGIENQSDIHYAMPVRNMLYDALDYASQVVEEAKENKKEGKTRNSAQFLSGVSKECKIKPVVTLVINWSESRWDGPRKLTDMMGDYHPALKKCVNDYKINLIDPYDVEDFGMFHTELGDVLSFIKNQNDKNYLKKLKNMKGSDWKMDVDTVAAINAFTGSRIPIEGTIEGGRVDMCKATEALIEEGMERRDFDKIADMLGRGKKPEDIADFCNYPIEQVLDVEKALKDKK